MKFKKPLIVAGILLALPLSAMAYVDPGSGMLMWQGLIAAIGAGGVFAGRIWRGVKSIFKKPDSR